MSRTARRLRVTAVAALAAALPLAALTVPTAHATEDPAARPGVTKRWGPQQETPGTMTRATIMDDGTIVDVSGLYVLRRSRDDTRWGGYDKELSFRYADQIAYCSDQPPVGTSGRSLVTSRVCRYDDRGVARFVYAWSSGTGWDRLQVGPVGPQWTGVGDQVGVGRHSWTPETGWTMLPRIPFEPRTMAADARGRVTAVGGREGALVTSTFRPGRGWGRVDTLTADFAGGARLAVAGSGSAAVTGFVDPGTAAVWRRTGPSAAWQRALLTKGSESEVAVNRAGDLVVGLATYGSPAGPRGVVVRRWLHQDAAPRPAATLQVRNSVSFGSLDVSITGSGEARAVWGSGGSKRGTWGSTSSGDGWSKPDRLAQNGQKVGLAVGGGCTLVATAGGGDRVDDTARVGGRCASAATPPEPTDDRPVLARLRGPGPFRSWNFPDVKAVQSRGRTVVGAYHDTGTGFRTVLAVRKLGGGWSRTVVKGSLGRLLGTSRGVIATVNKEYLTWEPGSGWTEPRPLPGKGFSVVAVSEDGSTIAVGRHSLVEGRPLRVHVRVDGRPWTDLPVLRPTDAGVVGTRLLVDDAGDVAFADHEGVRHYDADTGWSRRSAPGGSEGRDLSGWQMNGDGAVAVRIGTRYAVAPDGRDFGAALPTDGLRLVGDEMVAVRRSSGCGGGRRRALAVETADLVTGERTTTPLGCTPPGSVTGGTAVVAGPGGRLLVRVRFAGFDATDSLYVRGSDGSWSPAQTVPGGFGLRPTYLGTDPAVTTGVNLRRRGLWLAR